MMSSDEVKCPFCGSSKVEFLETKRASLIYLCSECGREFATGPFKSILFLWA
jgi:DNA-directed RNA polymerase subunit RPC12/RpoP